jgi:hypothetical protein
MKCPLLIIATLIEQGRYDWAKSDCLKEECAWWHGREAECSISSLARDIKVIKSSLYAIEAKTPYGQKGAH